MNSPSAYDPYYNLEKATQRRATVLNLMVDHGYITQEECDLLGLGVSAISLLGDTYAQNQKELKHYYKSMILKF